MINHVSMLLAIGGIGLFVLGWVFGIVFERKRRVGPLVDRLWEAEAELKKKG